MGPVVTDGSTVTVISHLPTPALPGQVRTVDGPKPSSQHTRRALPRVFTLVWLDSPHATLPSPRTIRASRPGSCRRFAKILTRSCPLKRLPMSGLLFGEFVGMG